MYVIAIITFIKLYNQCKMTVDFKAQFKPFSLNPVDIFLVIRDKSHVMLGNRVVIHGK